MPRRGRVPKRQVLPDVKYGSEKLARFINKVMRDGKKSVAQRILYDALDLIRERLKGVDPLEVFKTAVENVKPKVEVRSRRVGGATYQVPVEVNPQRRQALAIRWIIQAARARSGRPMYRRLADELIAAYNREGAAMTRRENVHRMAEANKAFAHFAW